MKFEIYKNHCYLGGFVFLGASLAAMYFDNRLDFVMALIGFGLILLGYYESIREQNREGGG